jgi:hypothetical protein
MARKLNSKQKKLVEGMAKKGFYSFTQVPELEELIAQLNWYETVYHDMERYLGDCYSKIKYGGGL